MRSVNEAQTGEVRDCISRDVVSWVEELGAAPMLVPNGLRDAVACVRESGASGVLLTGGNDCGEDPVRDATEEALLRYAVDASLPVFGMCRGMQMIVRCFGGRVEPMLPARAHIAVRHAIALQRDALDVWCDGGHSEERVMTNSYHKFGVREEALPEELTVFARSDDGYVEGIRHRALPIAGVMWHPERAGSCKAFDAALMRTWLAWCAQAAVRA